MTWTLPNILTVGRLLAALALALVFVILPRPFADWAALVLFVAAALTDFLDGYLARKWNQTSAFGRMLDPIADKAMVVIALAVLMGLNGLNALLLVPASLILFREVFVSGLREFLGADAGKLKVTGLAKWKTTVQMFAIPALFLTGIFQAEYEAIYYTNDPGYLASIMAGQAADEIGIMPTVWRFSVTQLIAIILIWLAALLTIVTGADYFRKALPFLRDDRKES
ncbi:CDP-diacylglycerol--glycerol-3-phosphate 3-phosphatidyltransferase [Algicella marina]|uniref:CDP-diacylglycerol--glycerol-3-phosphate 3-phosphatidyltransferase n=1 Tax=Algicella marina TaxID=2683284 RepID=A0A6P1SZN0_9RHOB|nr:CDP-diacylglycerol--glycerol-3-phosphate 3-phosphatidyltransferase [Algicella marina]QHQ35938.1 CDP-diacylglycerol--glycerol-3-phosphate 3-phosphatidyltransferase [Algicella marina]